ncbi:MAG: hypothetical protein AAF530_08480 [Pseudomonadota bacterium]
MDQDVKMGVSMGITQADIAHLRAQERLGEYAVVYRVARQNMGGGFGDQDRHPFAWAVLVYVDGQVARLFSARGAGREWNSLDRLEKWLREQGFWYWWTRNDLEPLGLPFEEPGELPPPDLPPPITF